MKAAKEGKKKVFIANFIEKKLRTMSPCLQIKCSWVDRSHSM